MSRHPDQGAIAAVITLASKRAAAAAIEDGGAASLDPRLVAAEIVAACALHLVQQWHAWESLNRTALACMGTQDGPAAMAALTAYELVDAAVNAWAPHAHPAVRAHPGPSTAQ